MIKPYEGAKAERNSNFGQLPRGCYVAKVLAVKVDSTSYGDKLMLQLDITEGEYADFFKKQYESRKNGQYEAKFKGVYSVGIPDNNSESWKQRAFNRLIGAFEASNDGFHWEWDERKLVGKNVGINVRGSYYNGNEFTEIGGLEVVEDVRAGKCKPMKDRIPKGDAYETPEKPAMTAIADEDIPF